LRQDEEKEVAGVSMSNLREKEAVGRLMLFGFGTGDDSIGYFVEPTVILTSDPQSITMRKEVFGPVLTVYLFDDDKLDETLELIDTTADYALTGSM
jgi:1-pyrroline-5-carboxylate dehydrogenase